MERIFRVGSILRLVSITAQNAMQDKAQVKGRLAKGVARFRRAAAVAAGPETTRIESSLRSRDKPNMDPPKPANVTLTMDSNTCSMDKDDDDDDDGAGGIEELGGASDSVMMILIDFAILHMITIVASHTRSGQMSQH